MQHLIQNVSNVKFQVLQFAVPHVALEMVERLVRFREHLRVNSNFRRTFSGGGGVCHAPVARIPGNQSCTSMCCGFKLMKDS